MEWGIYEQFCLLHEKGKRVSELWGFFPQSIVSSLGMAVFFLFKWEKNWYSDIMETMMIFL